MKVVTAAEMREIDRITIQKYGIPALALMENAGAAVAEFVLENYPQANSIGVLCGKGNNGGDGLVAARKLHQAGRKVSVLLLAKPSELLGEAAEMFKRLPVEAAVAQDQNDLAVERSQQVFSSDLLLDAVLGAGFKPPLNAFHSAVRDELVNQHQRRASAIISVDVPSGADVDSVVPPFSRAFPSSAVVTFTAPKLRQVFDVELARGPIAVAHIGTPEEAIISQTGLHVATARDFTRLLPLRPAASHKGDFGHVLVIGGSVGKAGAAALAGMAALRSGAGLVTVAAPRSILATVARFSPDLMTHPLEQTAAGTISPRNLESKGFAELLTGKTVVALGPGLSQHPGTVKFVHEFVRTSRLPMILDTDGLNAFSGHSGQLTDSKCPLVLTPHPGELARLTALSIAEVQKDRVISARTFARQHRAIVVLKGSRTLTAGPDGSTWVNTTGNPAMAKGGTGDALTGIIAALLAQNFVAAAKLASVPKTPDTLAQCVAAAVYLHGLAGDLAAAELDEHSMLATDLIAALPQAFRRAQERATEKFLRITT